MECSMMLSAYHCSTYWVMLAGNFKDLFATFISLFFIHDLIITTRLIVSLTISFMAAFIYCFIKYF